MKPYIKVADERDAIRLAKNLREEDKQELKAYGNLKYDEALKMGVAQSKIPLAIYDKEGKIVFMCGVRVINSSLGQIWLLASPRIEKLSIPFLRNCKAGIDLFTQDHKLLFNYVDVRNELHIKWLRWCGFTFINKHEEFGFEKRPFYEFVKI
jgi:hypothetical protein